MRDLESQLRAWTDQAEPVTADDAVTEAESISTTPFARPDVDASGRRRAWALLAAAVVLVAGVAAVAFRDSGADDGSTPAGPGTVDPAPTASTDPGPATTDPGPATTDPGSATTTPVDATDPGTAGRPSVLVAYTGDNRLVTLDPDTGEIRRVLADGFDAPDAQIEGGPFVVGDIAVDVARGRVLYGTCCEPAVGQIFTVGLDAGEAESFRFGDRPVLSPDGTELAVVEMDELRVIELATGGERSYPLTVQRAVDGGAPISVGLVVDDIAWSPDGAQLLLVTTDHVAGKSEVRLVTFDGGSDLVFAARVLAEGPSEGERRVSVPRFGADGSIAWIRQNVYDAVDGAAIEERIASSDGDGLSVTPLAHEVRSRIVDGRGVEWRLSADGTVTEGDEVRFTLPGLRVLAG